MRCKCARPESATLSDIQKQLWETSFEESQQVLNVNALGSFFTFVAFMKLLDAGNHHADSPGKAGLVQSQFVSTTSVAALSRAESVGHAYMASKAALLHLTKVLATGFAKYGIRSNSILPGLYITEMTEVCSPRQENGL